MDPYGQLTQFVHECEYQRRIGSEFPRRARTSALLREADLLAQTPARRRESRHSGPRWFGVVFNGFSRIRRGTASI